MRKLSFIFVLIFVVAIYLAPAQEKKSFGSTKKTTQTEQQKEGKHSFEDTKTNTETKGTTKSKKTTAKMFKGYVVSLAAVMQGNYSLTKAQAKKLADAGSPIVLISSKSKSGKIYFLVDQGGAFLGKKLANYAVYKKVAVSGWYKYVNRTRFIVVDFIESAE